MATDAVPFLRALGAALIREKSPEEGAAAAHAALQPVWEGQRTLVLDVQFTGFSTKGQLVGGVSPALLRAAGSLIVHRVSRIGFTPEATPGDLEAFLRAATRTPGELGAEGILGPIRAAAPRGVYLSTSSGEAYRPAAPPAAPPAEEPPPAVAATAAPAAPPTPIPVLTEEEAEDLSAFEFVDDLEDLTRAPAAASPGREPAGGGGQGGSGSDMFAFFRTAGSDRMEVEASALPGMLHSAEDMQQFERLTEECTRTALRLLRGDMHDQATLLLEALVQEAERTDRSRLLRESAGQALRRATTAETLPHIAELLRHTPAERDRVLRVLSFVGGDALALLENTLFRTPDVELRRAIFRRLLTAEGGARRAVVRSLLEAPPRLRAILELVTLPEVEAEFAHRWLADAAQHQDPTVRADVARHAAAVGGRPGLRVLLDLLSDADGTVVRAAILGLATLGDPAAVPFLARLLNDNVDEATQLGAIAALGRTGSPDALPPLLALVNRRQLISTKRVQRLKTAAVEAIARTRAPAARDILHGIMNGSDSELAAEARRALVLLD